MATEENLYDDLEDSSGSEQKRLATNMHYEEDMQNIAIFCHNIITVLILKVICVISELWKQ